MQESCSGFTLSSARCDSDYFPSTLMPLHACRMQDYGAYLEADAIAAAASCREMEWALQEVLQLAEQCSDYKSNERYHTYVPAVFSRFNTFFVAR